MTMASTDMEAEAAPIIACTVTKNIEEFDLLIEDMEAELGAAWGDLTFEDAIAYLEDDEGERLEFLAVAVGEPNEQDFADIAEILRLAKERGIRVILIASDEVSPIALHRLMRLGADDFVPYPLPEGALHEAIERIRTPEEPPVSPPLQLVTGGQGRGARARQVHVVHGVAGGVGASTLAVNLAWELANSDRKNPPRVALLDFSFQQGSSATYLDLPRRDVVIELLQELSGIDEEAFSGALQTYRDRLSVFTAPPEIVPLDIVTPEEVEGLIELARSQFDHVVIDLPTTVVAWFEVVLNAADDYLLVMERDLRSIQNALRLLNLLKSEEMPIEKTRLVLNRAPGFTDLAGKARVKRICETLERRFDLLLPDGGKAVGEAGDQGAPLGVSAARNPLRKAIALHARKLRERAVQNAADTGG